MLANNVREVFWVIDPKTLRAVYLNQAFERVTGVPLTDVLADRKAWRKVLHPEDRARVEETLDHSNAVGEPYNIEFRIVRGDGETRWIWARGEPVEDERGESMLVGVAEDITGRKRVEQELERSLSLLRATLHATADGILALDRGGRITTFNNRFVELWRIPDHVPIEAGKEEGLWNYVREQLQDAEAFERRRKEIERHEKSDSCDVLQFIDGRIFEVYQDHAASAQGSTVGYGASGYDGRGLGQNGS
jgi:PAS domain S-box-containing protein